MNTINHGMSIVDPVEVVGLLSGMPKGSIAELVDAAVAQCIFERCQERMLNFNLEIEPDLRRILSMCAGRGYAKWFGFYIQNHETSWPGVAAVQELIVHPMFAKPFLEGFFSETMSRESGGQIAEHFMGSLHKLPELSAGVRAELLHLCSRIRVQQTSFDLRFWANTCSYEVHVQLIPIHLLTPEYLAAAVPGCYSQGLQMNSPLGSIDVEDAFCAFLLVSTYRDAASRLLIAGDVQGAQKAAAAAGGAYVDWCEAFLGINASSVGVLSIKDLLDERLRSSFIGGVKQGMIRIGCEADSFIKLILASDR